MEGAKTGSIIEQRNQKRKVERREQYEKMIKKLIETDSYAEGRAHHNAKQKFYYQQQKAAGVKNRDWYKSRRLRRMKITENALLD